MTGHKTYALGDVTLQSGEVLKNAQLAYATYGTLNATADNAVLLPTFFTGTHLRNEALFGPGRAIDPARHFVVSVNLFGNGYSSSPSNTRAPQDGPRFPQMTLYDNVACQHRLLTKHFGVRRIALVLGWSLAAMQAYQWAAQYPGMVEAILPYGGAARCSPTTTRFSTAPRRRCRPTQPGTTATMQLRRKRACAPSVASTPPGLIPTNFSRRPLSAARLRHA